MAPVNELDDAIAAFKSGDLEQAQGLAEKALAQGESPQSHHLLGLIYCRQNDAEKGVEHLRAAAEAEPRNVGFRVMLARALVDSGRTSEVLAMPPPGPIRSAADLALWEARAEAAASAGNLDLAVDAWSTVTAAAPRHWRAWANLGNSLSALKRWSEAAAASMEAAKLNPGEPRIRSDAIAAMIEHGRQLQMRLNFDEAEAVFRRAYELDPFDREAVHNLGMSLERTNRIAELRTLVNDAISGGIEPIRLGYLRAVLAWREGDSEEAWNLLEGVDAGEEPVIWTLRAKVADVLGKSEAAFEAATEMNRCAIERAVTNLDRDGWERRGRDYRQEQRQLATKITRDWAAKLPTVTEPPRQKLAFLVGFPRSGTTLLDTFLLGHPEVEVLEEKQLVGAAGKVAGPIAELPGISLELLGEARETYFEKLAKYVDPAFGGLIIDKFPLDIGAAPLIHAMFPGAPVIFAQRHPCDVVLSGYLQPFGVTNFSNIAAAADYYDAMMSLWTASIEALPLRVHTVVYEELVRDPEAVLKPVVDFLGLQWDERILDHRRTAKERGTIVTPSYDQVTEPVTTRSSGRWKRYSKQLEPVLPILLPWAERLGYAN